MELVKCGEEDLALLALLNKELFEDESNDNIPSIEVLKGRMKDALDRDSEAYFFVEQGEVVGYALVKTQVSPYYLSHFYICRDYRKKHLGTTAFSMLINELKTDAIDLDVFCWNRRGREFWKSLGFTERAIMMRRSEG